MGTTVTISGASPVAAEADAVVIGVMPGPDGLVLAPGAEDVDKALDGSLAATLATLGASGDPGEVTKIATGGRLAAPLLAAAGLGDPADGSPAASGPLDPESLRRAAGAAVRALAGGPGNGRREAGRPERIALALPARDEAEAAAVTMGALLGGYTFGRYRDDSRPAPELTLLADEGRAAGPSRRAQVIADAVTLARDLVNTGPSDLVPAALAAEAERVAAASGLAAEVLDEHALAAG
ncbi:MAG: leucyl aminopeptidase, partial [Actinobacteria bacterium]|nr:leucyl aminopeptidase [Actinomycetota bacterium]